MRFNALLDRLATHLPGYPPTEKWTKAQVIENAIRFAKASQSSSRRAAEILAESSGQTRADPGLDDNDFSRENESQLRQRCRVLQKQNRLLRDILRGEIAPDISEKDFSEMTVAEITAHVERLKRQDREGTDYFLAL